jgi:methanogenic corrinoid protein MtbC1
MNSFGSNLKTIRKEKKISQKVLAQSIGVGQTTIANYENDLRYPNPKILSKLADVLDISLDALIIRQEKQVTIDDLDIYIDDFIDFVFSYEEDQAIALVMKLVKSGVDVIEIYNKFLKGTLYRVGTLWEQGKVSIPMEHHITYFIDKILVLLSPYIHHEPSNNRTAIFIAPGSETHLVGLKIVKEVFKKYGWKTLFIGKSVPWTSLAKWIEKNNAELVVISTTLEQNLNQVEAIVEYIKSETKAKVMIGGQAYKNHPEVVDRINADYYTSTDEGLMKLVKQI